MRAICGRHLGDPAKAVDHCRSAVQLLGAPPNPPESDLEISAALIEAQMDLASAYASAAQAAGAAPKRAEFWREARLSATASLQMAQSHCGEAAGNCGGLCGLHRQGQGAVGPALITGNRAGGVQDQGAIARRICVLGSCDPRIPVRHTVAAPR